MKVSIVIPTYCDFEYLTDVIYNIRKISNGADIEFILVNDGSINPDGTPRKLTWGYDNPPFSLKSINNHKNYGIGYSFDRGVFEASGDIIILSGADVLPRGRSWLVDVINAIKTHPDEIGCATTLALSPDQLDLEKADKRYYGADLLYKYNGYNEKWISKILRTDGHYTSILEGKWRETKDGDEPYEVPCLMGALYFCTKAWYQKIHGFDTEKGNDWKGHKRWSNLEPFLSLKTKVYGGKIRLYPNIEVGHVFGRKVSGGRNKDFQFWNRLWCAETMFTEDARKSLYDHLKFEHNLSVAQHWIKIHQKTVEEVRDRNTREGSLIDKIE